MSRLTKAQQKRMLERVVTLLHEDIHTEGFQEQCEAIGLPISDGKTWMQKERDAMLRRAARVDGGEAQTRMSADPVTAETP